MSGGEAALSLSFKAKLQLHSIDTGKSHRNQSSVLIAAPRTDIKPRKVCCLTASQHLTTRAPNCPGAGPPRRRRPLSLGPPPLNGNRCPRRRRGRPAPPAAAQLVHAPRPTGMNPAAPLAPPRRAAPRRAASRPPRLRGLQQLQRMPRRMV